MKITSPDSNYTGKSSYGLTALEFKNGVAEVKEIPAGVRSYLQGAGYGIDGAAENPKAEEPADPRNLDDGQLGTPLRDAAVDPTSEDYLAPTNAGEANPHGPEVVSPEIHASQGARPVKGGEVHVDDTAKQDAAETAAAKKTARAKPAAKPNAEKE